MLLQYKMMLENFLSYAARFEATEKLVNMHTLSLLCVCIYSILKWFIIKYFRLNVGI